jgi:plastocyanin
MHAAIAHLAPILAAEKSKTPFYIAGGVLVAWALLVSLGWGLRVSGFPGTAAAERLVMAVTAGLVVIAAAMAVATSGGSTRAQASPVATGSSPASAAGSGARPSSAAEAGAQPPGAAGGPQAPAAPSPPRVGGGSSLTQAADPSGQLRFEKQTLTARAGTVSIEFTNRSPLPHNLTIAAGGRVLGATPTFDGGSKRLQLRLRPGTYQFFCSVPGHREAGMQGTLVVR